MKLRISDVNDDLGHPLVRFHCAHGTAVATWCSSHSPRVGAEYDVEVDVDATLDRHNSEFVAVEEFSIGESDSYTHLSGQLESIDVDWMAYFRLGPDTLVMIEMIPEAYEPGIWLKITIPSRDLRITPFGGP